MEERFRNRKRVLFENTLYKAEWLEKVPGTGSLYRMGFARQSERDSNIYAVYDGAQNYLGFVYADGRFTVSGEADATGYKESFLSEAAKAVVRAIQEEQEA